MRRIPAPTTPNHLASLWSFWNRWPGYRGVSLSEVLISTLVMSIGVVALATLFPVSVLRSIQATQLTHATILRYNAETWTHTIPHMLTIAPKWQPTTSYQSDDAIVPALTSTQGMTIPAVFITDRGGISGTQEPVWSYREGTATQDGSVTWHALQLSHYVIDPLGYVLMSPESPPGAFRSWQGMLNGTQKHFGNVNRSPFLERLNRFPVFGQGQFVPSDSSTNNEIRTAQLAMLPDSWQLQWETQPGGLAYLTPTTVELVGVDAAVLSSSVQVPSSGLDPTPDRIILMDETGRHGISRILDQTPTAGSQGAVISWKDPLPPLSFTPVKARIESQDRRYSYLISVRRYPGRPPRADVVVFFRRRFSEEDEQVYPAIFRRVDRGNDGQPGAGGVDDNRNGTSDDPTELGAPGSDDKPRNFVIVQYHSGGPKPFFKKGGYICDIFNLRWYRIQDVYEPLIPGIAAATPQGYETDPVAMIPEMSGPCDRFVRLTLDRYIEEDSGIDPRTLNAASRHPDQTRYQGFFGGAVLMRGIIDVFPIAVPQQGEE